MTTDRSETFIAELTDLVKLMRSSTHPSADVRSQLGYAANLLEGSIEKELDSRHQGGS